VQGDALGTLVDYLHAHPAVGAAGPCLLNPDGSVQSSRRRFPTLAAGLFESTPWAWHWPSNPAARRYAMEDVPPATAGPVDWVTGAAILVRGRALAAVGGFDTGFFMYAEELDLCRRLKDAGWATHFCPAARIVHLEGQSSGQVVPARHLHFCRSRVRYFRKHHGALAAELVRLNLRAGYAVEWGIEGLKGLLGHRTALRRARMQAYAAVLRDGLKGDV
jgi:GT2 family glycosyltransferase